MSEAGPDAREDQGVALTEVNDQILPRYLPARMRKSLLAISSGPAMWNEKVASR